MDGAALSYRHPRSGEWAHDVRNPLREARLVSVDPAWALRPPAHDRPLRWLEVGFGRGLNSATALLRLREEGIRPSLVQADGCEAHPELLEPWPELPAIWRDCAPWWGARSGCWPLAGQAGEARLLAAAAPECLSASGWPAEPGYDWIFLDLFSPGAHPEDWRPGLIEELTTRTQPGGVLTSYCCARVLRDQLEACGWQVERLRRAGLRDTLRARLAPSGPTP